MDSDQTKSENPETTEKQTIIPIQGLSHKVITPIHPQIIVEPPLQRTITPIISGIAPDTAVMQSDPTAPSQTTANNIPLGVQQDIIVATPEKFNAPMYWAGKTIRLIFAAIVGFFITGSYYAYLDGGNILSRGQLYIKHYSPLVLIDTLIISAVVILVYGLLLRFVLRSKSPFMQAFVALTISQLSVILMLGIVHFNDKAVNILGGLEKRSVFLALLIGVITFTICNYLAERVWTWRIPRAAIGISTIVILFFASFGLSKTIASQYSQRKQKEIVSSDKAKADGKQGVYNFDANYQQYFIGDQEASRYTLDNLGGPAVVPSEDAKGDPHFTYIRLIDKQYSGTNDQFSFSLWQYKVPLSFNPPQNCGNPSPGMDYLEQVDKTGIYDGPCILIKSIAGKGDLYGRQESKFKDIQEEAKAQNKYDWYYIRYGDTLITLTALGTLNGDDVATLLSGLKPITAPELLQKSKDFAAQKKN